MKPAASLAKNETAAATSSGVPMRRTGIRSAALLTNSTHGTLIRSAVVRVVSVAMNPGATALAVIWNGPSSMAKILVSP